MAADQLLEHFKCPISLEIMSDPVILSSGQTFERSSIQQWLDRGHRKCPITKLPLIHTYLIPNHTLRAIISSLVRPPPPPRTQNLPHPPSPQAQTQIQTLTLTQTLVSALTSCMPTNYKLDSLNKLTFLSQHDPLFRRNITYFSLIPALFSCIDDDDEALRHKSLSFLLNLSLDGENKVGLMAEGILDRLISILTAEVSDCRAVAATLITSLAVHELNSATIGADPRAIEALVSLIRDGVGRERKEAATALYVLCGLPYNKVKAVECGAVPVLLRRLDSDSGLQRCVEVIGVLAECKEAIEEMEKFGGCVEVLAGVLKNGNRTSVEYALLALNHLCSNSEESVTEAVRAGVLEICFVLKHHDNEKVRANASSLFLVLCPRKQ